MSSLCVKGQSRYTYSVVILLFTQCKAEFWVVNINLFVLGSENDHDTVLQEIIKVDRVGVQALTFEIVDPKHHVSKIQPRKRLRLTLCREDPLESR
jgi:hypothetical protein